MDADGTYYHHVHGFTMHISCKMLSYIEMWRR